MLLLVTLVVLTGIIDTSSAWAHKINVYAYLEEGQIKGEGYFPGGDKAINSPVEVLDGQGRVVANTKTDQEGLFSLPKPANAPEPLKVVLRAGQGHMGEYTLETGAKTATAMAGKPAPGAGAAKNGAAGAPGMDQAQLEAALDRLLEQRLQPLTAQVAKLSSQRGPTLADIIGGLGYILGLMGLAAYLKSRKAR